MSLSHLAPSVREFVSLPDEERRRLICSDRWIGYPLATRTLEGIEEILHRPRVSRMRSLLIHGESGMGKTLIRLKMERDYATGFPVGPNDENRPLISLQLPARPDERRFFTHLLDALGAPPRPRDTLDQIEISALRLLRHLKPAAFLLDEFQHVGTASARDVQALLNLLKFLSNDLETPIIAFGTDAAISVIKLDRQIDSRFYKLSMPVWRDTKEFVDLVASIIAAMPLKNASNVTDRSLIRALLDLSEGITGEVFHLISTAAGAAVGQKENITVAGIEAAANMRWRIAG